MVEKPGKDKRIKVYFPYTIVPAAYIFDLIAENVCKMLKIVHIK